MKNYKQIEAEILARIVHFGQPVAAFHIEREGCTQIRKVPLTGLFPQNMKTLIGIYNTDCQPGYIADDLKFLFGEQQWN